MSDPVKDAAKQMDDWAARQAEGGLTGSVRMMGQTIGPLGNSVTPVYERRIGHPAQAEENPPLQRDLAILRWVKAKIEYDEATRELETFARKLRGY
jgi:hypothetical protein